MVVATVPRGTNPGLLGSLIDKTWPGASVLVFRKRSCTWNTVLRLVWPTVTAIAVRIVARMVMVVVRKTRVGKI